MCVILYFVAHFCVYFVHHCCKCSCSFVSNIQLYSIVSFFVILIYFSVSPVIIIDNFFYMTTNRDLAHAHWAKLVN